MRTVYATQFKIPAADGQAVSELTEAVAQVTCEWVKDKYRQLDNHVDFDFTSGEIIPRPQHHLNASVQAIDGSALLILDWSFPHDTDPSVIWQTSVSIAARNRELEVAIVVRISSVKFAIKPLEYDLGRPRLVPGLVGKFQSFTGRTRLQRHAISLDAPDIEDFVRNVLLAKDRVLPVVLVSPDVFTDTPCVDADAMQDLLCGLAIVAELKTKWAAFFLTDAVGRTYSCYNGAVRVYWPGFTADDTDHAVHQVFLAATIKANEARGRPLPRYLFRTLSALAAFRFIEGDLTSRVRAALDDERRAHFEKVVQEARNGSSAVDAEFLELALSENDQLQKTNQQLKDRLLELESEIATYRANLSALTEFQGVEAGSADELQDEGAPSTVLQALQSIANRKSDALLIYPNAFESAAAADFARPDDVLKALVAIADLAHEYFESKKDKRSMGTWETWFQKRGLKYSPTESQNTLNMYGDDREFSHNGHKRQMLRHLTIGKGDTKNCLQIYFEPNDRTERIEIGHCGRHLRYYGKGT